MEMRSELISNSLAVPSHDGERHQDNAVPEVGNHCDTEPKPEISEEEIKGVLEVIASTGKFWHDWDKLKGMLSFQLKQVLSEYPEAKMNDEQQNASLGETYPELVKRLDEVLLSFDEGPPFTLQRLCEILLAAQSIYPKLSKLALALEKNLLVTSVLAATTEPYPRTTGQKPEETNKESEESSPPTNSVTNGVDPMGGDKDEIMAEVEEGGGDDDSMTIDMEPIDGMVAPSETNSETKCNT